MAVALGLAWWTWINRHQHRPTATVVLVPLCALAAAAAALLRYGEDAEIQPAWLAHLAAWLVVLVLLVALVFTVAPFVLGYPPPGSD